MGSIMKRKHSKYILLTVLACGIFHTLFAQPKVKVEVSADTIAIGQTVEVTYTIENGQGQFQPPDLSQVPVISGPNTSSSMMYQNGRMTSSQSYSFVLLAEEEGKLSIPQASFVIENETVRIDPVEIVVTKYIKGPTVKRKTQEAEPSKPLREKRKF
jgi:hypothetical protein